MLAKAVTLQPVVRLGGDHCLPIPVDRGLRPGALHLELRARLGKLPGLRGRECLEGFDLVEGVERRLPVREIVPIEVGKLVRRALECRDRLVESPCAVLLQLVPFVAAHRGLLRLLALSWRKEGCTRVRLSRGPNGAPYGTRTRAYTRTMTGPQLRLLLREMTAEDISAVRRIEVAAYEDAWPQTTFEQELRNAFATYLVVVDVSDPPGYAPRTPWWARIIGAPRPTEAPVVGYCGAWFHVDQLHVVTIAVAPAYQGHGIAQHMLLECFDRAAAAELRNVALEVRPSNLRARAIYERFGFAQMGIHRAYYANNGEDALIMLTPDLDGTEQRARLEAIRAELDGRYPEVVWLDRVDTPAADR